MRSATTQVVENWHNLPQWLLFLDLWSLDSLDSGFGVIIDRVVLVRGVRGVIVDRLVPIARIRIVEKLSISLGFSCDLGRGHQASQTQEEDKMEHAAKRKFD